MDDPVKIICDELGVCRGVALFYLEGFKWNLESAMDACRMKTLPPLPSVTVESSPGVSVNEKSASEPPSTQPLAIDSRRSSYQPAYPAEEQPPQSKNELIAKFYEVTGTSVDEARQFLEYTNWKIDPAVTLFLDERRPTPSQRKLQSDSQGYSSDDDSRDDDLPIAQLMSRRYSTGDRTMTDQYYSKGVKIGSAMEVDPTKSLNEARPLMASSQIQESTNPDKIREQNLWPPMDVWIDRICDAAEVCREEALFYLEGCKWKFDAAMEACRSKTLPPDMESAESPQNLPEQPSRVYKEQLIDSFVEAVRATRQQAAICLQSFNWNVNEAVGSFLEGFSADETSMAKQMSLMGFGDPPLSSVGLPSKSQFQGPYVSQNQGGYMKEGVIGSSSSSINADPTETQRSLEDVAVAISGVTLSQGDGKAAEEDSKTETFPDPLAIQDRTTVGPLIAPTFIEISIILADDGSTLDIPFRSGQTVRDIHNAIDERTQINDRDYYLQSLLGVEYRDLNVTVDKISAGGSTTLIQTLPDP